MKSPKEFCSRLPINPRGLAELEKTLKGLAAGIIATVEKHALAKGKGARAVVGVYLEWQGKCFGEYTITVWRKYSTSVLFDHVLMLMDAVRASSDKGNREIRACVTILDEKD